MYTTIVKQSLKLNINKLLINNNKNLINRSLSGHGESHDHEHHEHLVSNYYHNNIWHIS